MTEVYTTDAENKSVSDWWDSIECFDLNRRIVYGGRHLDVAAAHEVVVDMRPVLRFMRGRFMWRYNVIYENASQYRGLLF